MYVIYDMKVYSEHCTQDIVNNNKTQYKQANIFNYKFNYNTTIDNV